MSISTRPRQINQHKQVQINKIAPDLTQATSPPSLTILCSRYWPDRHGGVEQRMGHVSQAFARQGFDVEVLTGNRTEAPSVEIIEPGLNVRRFDPPQLGRLWRWQELPHLRWWGRVIDCWAKPGLIWAADPIMAAAAIFHQRGDDLIFNPAGCVAGMRESWRRNPHVISMHRPRRLIWLDRFAYRHAKRVVVSSQNLKRQYERFYGRRDGDIYVTPHGVQSPVKPLGKTLSRLRLGIPQDALVTGFVGRLDPCKGLGFLFESIRRMNLTEHDRLLLVGDGPDRERLQALARRLGLMDHIIWTGAMPDPSSAYAAMDVLVLPSVYEAFGLVFLEAMSHGLPVIGRRGDDQSVFTAADEIIDDGSTGLLTHPTDPADLAAKLRQLRDNPAWRQTLGRRARDHARLRPWSRVVEDYITQLDLPRPRQTANALAPRAKAA